MCPVGHYCPGHSNAIKCPLGHIGATTAGQSSPSTCSPCTAGTYPDPSGSICVDCPPGYYCPGGTDKIPCGHGHFIATSKRSTPCDVCPVGTYTNTKIAITCVSCVAGGYCPGGGTNFVACPAGKYSNTVGQTSDTCLSCLAGFYSTAGAIFCFTCSSGYYCPGGTDKIPCPAGKATTSAGSDSAICNSIVCAAGKYSTPGSAFCRTCPSGHYCGGGTDATPCPAGKFNSVFGSSETTACVECTAGTYSSAGATFCFSCPGGYYCPENSDKLPCQAGAFSPNVNEESIGACSGCEAGKYSSAGSSYCRVCPAGSYCPGTTDVMICAVGKYSIQGAASCSDCEAGKYTISPGAIYATDCTSCPAGYFCPEGSDRIPYPAGRYTSQTGRLHSAMCDACQIGEYSSAPGATVCTPCPPQYTTVDYASTSCILLTSSPSSQPSGLPSTQPSAQPSGQPILRPSSRPSVQPSGQPSSSPTLQPSMQPSAQPFARPSALPSTQPTGQPSIRPSGQPSTQPSTQPISAPSAQPSVVPSVMPLSQPSEGPTTTPSSQPSVQPTGAPSIAPSAQPSGQPQTIPTAQPSAVPSIIPSSLPSAFPSVPPTSQPSSQPSAFPSDAPTSQPSSQPSAFPSVAPSSQPSSQPSAFPSVAPSSQPSTQPKPCPSGTPTTQPSKQPSAVPSSQPSVVPSILPSSQPTTCPSATPSFQPSVQPTTWPSAQSTGAPTAIPSRRPSSQPTVVPTINPSSQPSGSPSAEPSVCPSINPTSDPSIQPSIHPSSQPTEQPANCPSGQPSSGPSDQPSHYPTGCPTFRPSTQPSSQPSLYPSSQPTGQPTTHPTGIPSKQPTAQPSSQPSSTPSCQPSCQPNVHPTVNPTSQPTSVPSRLPSRIPTGQPSTAPTMKPLSAPTSEPTSNPSTQPFNQPPIGPSVFPSAQPSVRPSSCPSSPPSEYPVIGVISCIPTLSPSILPSMRSSGMSVVPTVRATSQPNVASMAPSVQKLAFPLSVQCPNNKACNFTITLPFLLTSAVSGFGAGNVVVMAPTDGVGYVLSSDTLGPHILSNRLSIADLAAVAPIVSLDFSGRSVATAGDINGDGYDDLIIGVPYASRVYVLFGTVYGFVNMTQGFTMFGAKSSDLTGWSVSGAGDVNNDTFADIIISSPHSVSLSGLLRAGAVFVLYGGNTSAKPADIYLDNVLPSHRGFILYGEALQDAFGLSVSGAGDVNGDGYDDIIVGALRMNALFSGAAYVIYGGELISGGGVTSLKTAAVRGDAFSWLGYSVAGAGRLNGDRFYDVIIGSLPHRTAADPPISYVLYGSANISTTVVAAKISAAQGLIVTGGGIIVAGVGDISGRGHSDVLIGGGIDIATGGGFVIQMPSTVPLISGGPPAAPTTFPSAAPSRMLTAQPSLRPTQPTAVPTIAPSGPTHSPTMTPTQPTSTPSTCPTAPSVAPSATPTVIPTFCPSKVPSRQPTEVPTGRPTHGPTVMRTMAPTTATPSMVSTTPTLSRTPVMRPSVAPSHKPTPVMSIYTVMETLTQNGTYYRTPEQNRTHYIINSTSNVVITGVGKGSLFTILPKNHSAVEITDFNISADVIDLRAFLNIHSLASLLSLIIIDSSTVPGTETLSVHFSGGQTLILVNVSMIELSERAFIFAVPQTAVGSDPEDDKKSPNSSTGMIVGLTIFCAFIACILYKLIMLWFDEDNTYNTTRVKPIKWEEMNMNTNRTFVTFLHQDLYDWNGSSSSHSTSSGGDDSNKEGSGSSVTSIIISDLRSSEQTSTDSKMDDEEKGEVNWLHGQQLRQDNITEYTNDTLSLNVDDVQQLSDSKAQQGLLRLAAGRAATRQGDTMETLHKLPDQRAENDLVDERGSSMSSNSVGGLDNSNSNSRFSSADSLMSVSISGGDDGGEVSYLHSEHMADGGGEWWNVHQSENDEERNENSSLS